MGWALVLNHLLNLFLLISFINESRLSCPVSPFSLLLYRAYHDGKARKGDDGTRGQSPHPVASPEKRFFFVSRSGEMFSYSANRIRTAKSKTQSWITKKMSRIANVIFIVPQMHNHDCHILLIASRGALRYVQRQLSWTLIMCVNMVRFMKS